MKNKLWNTCAVATIVLCNMGSMASAEITAETQDPIKLGVFNLPDVDFITNSFGEVLKIAGYQVEYVQADYTSHFTALEFGDIHMTPTVWGSTPDLLNAAVNSGKITNVGSNGLEIREGWWYPNYLVESCPSLPDWRALLEADCIEALSTPEAPGKIRYIGTPADWAPFDVERIKAFDLNVEMVLTGSQAALIATMSGAVQRKEKVIGFGFSPHWFFGGAEGTFVKFPTHDPLCMTDPKWGENPDEIGDCDLPQGTVYKLVNDKTETFAPGAVELLRRFKVTSADVSNATDQIENNGVSVQDHVAVWIEANKDKIAEWMK